MLLQRIRPATVRFKNGSEITLNSSVAGRIAKLSIARALAASKNLPGPDQLDDLHSEVLDPLNDLETALTGEIERLEGAANILRGQETYASGDLVNQAMFVRQNADALAIAQPDADMSELDRVAGVLDHAAKQLTEQLGLVRSRRAKADSFLRRTVATVVCRSQTDPDTAWEILQKHPGPIDWPVDTSEESDPQATFRQYQADARDAKRKQKNTAKAKARAELEAQAQRLWA